jgi:hypothetical protein
VSKVQAEEADAIRAVPARRGSSGWRAVPASIAVHALAVSGVAALVVRPVATAIEAQRAGVLRFPSMEATPVPVATTSKPPTRGKAPAQRAIPVAGTAPEATPIPVITPALEKSTLSEHDDTAAGCLTGCGDGLSEGTVTAAGLADGRGSVSGAQGAGHPLDRRQPARAAQDASRPARVSRARARPAWTAWWWCSA